MLSLTLVPASLHSLAGLSAAVILKAVYPALLAMFPVCVFLIARRVVSLRSAYVAGLVIVAQAAFIQQLPAIARQEMALLMFAALLAALTDRHLANGTRRALLLVFGVGLVVSHYSTAYTTIGLLALGVLVALVLTCLRRRVRLLPSAAFALVVVAGAAAVWYGPVTHSYSNAGLALDAVAKDGLKLLPGAEGKSPIDAYLQGNTGSTLTAAAYTTAARARYAKERPYVVPLPAGADARYALRDNAVPARGDQETGRRLRLADTVLLQLVNLLGALGGIALALRRRSSPIARLVGALAVGALAVLAVARLSGTVATSYNLERLSVQAAGRHGCGPRLPARRHPPPQRGRPPRHGRLRGRAAARRRHGLGPRHRRDGIARCGQPLPVGRGLRAVLDLARGGGRGALVRGQRPGRRPDVRRSLRPAAPVRLRAAAARRS